MTKSAEVKGYRQVRRIKSDKFDVEAIQTYTLSLLVGIRDFQFCVTSPSSELLHLEDIRLEGIKTINGRIKVLKEVWDNHHFLKAGFWKSVKLTLKTHKFTLVPEPHFVEQSKHDYLVINSEIKPTIESVYSYAHSQSNAVNVFAADSRLISWVKSLYPNRKVEVLHQGTAFIEGILMEGFGEDEPTAYCLLDKGILHVVVIRGRDLLYYNQFAVRKSEEMLKYLMLVFKEIGLSQKKTKVTLWGNFKEDNPHLDLLKKYIRHIHLGKRPTKVQFNFHQFDEIGEHQLFDLYNIHRCN